MLCKVTTTRAITANDVKVEKGMSVEVISQTILTMARIEKL